MKTKSAIAVTALLVRWKLRKYRPDNPNWSEAIVWFRYPFCKRSHRVHEKYLGPPNFTEPVHHRNRCGWFSIVMPWEWSRRRVTNNDGEGTICD